ncbi:MAG: hypothetical protein KF861_18760, partial [Planctomycetaceae bacterium]|nr:hypothetical protein [Planctomycetaceae bacterium]
LRSLPGRTSDSFMKAVFQEIKPGGVGVAHSVDMDYFYVVKVDERTYARSADLTAFRNRFLSEPVFAPYSASDYPKLAQNELFGYQTDWSDALLKKHHVEIIPRKPRQMSDEEGPDAPISSY